MKRTILQLSVSPDFAPIAAAIVTFFLIVHQDLLQDLNMLVLQSGCF